MQKTQPAKMERWISTFCKAKPICTLATSTYFFIPSLTQVSWLCFIQSQILRQKPSRKLFNSKQEKIFHLLHNPSQKWGIACLVSTPICLSVCKFLTERVFERGTVAKMKIERMYCVHEMVNERFQVWILSEPPTFVEKMVICTM